MRESLPARAIGFQPENAPGDDTADLLTRVEDQDGHVLIGIKPVSAAKSRATGVVGALTRLEMQAAISRLRELGVDVTTTYRNFTFVAARVAPAEVEDLLREPFVDYIEASGRT